ncbi:MAG TPA: transcription termination/antitermination NusG family protein [Verrucomicrobiae bacterium]|nr:transcription termination/antitermination NusG family protein [Verrucomicrobiae bacterium]
MLSAFTTSIQSDAWYCVRTKPKHEHIAAANLRKNLNLQVFHPRLRVERVTKRGLVRTNESLFPCYIFVRCVIDEKINQIKRTGGVTTVVHFAQRIPIIEDTIIDELIECFAGEEAMAVENRIAPGDEVLLADGAFAGMRAFVLRVMPAKRRIQILLDFLGRPTPAEVDESSAIVERNSVVDLVPVLAARLSAKAVLVSV